MNIEVKGHGYFDFLLRPLPVFVIVEVLVESPLSLSVFIIVRDFDYFKFLCFFLVELLLSLPCEGFYGAPNVTFNDFHYYR
jgi:hypothetical protein